MDAPDPRDPRPDYSFDWAIAPTDPETFFAEHYERAPLVLRRGQPEYYRDLISFAEIDRILSTMGLSAPEITLTRADAAMTAEDYTFDGGMADPVRVAALFGDGATVILGGLQDRLPALAAFCRACEAQFSCRVQTNIYMTPPLAQGFPAHYDSHDVLVLQVEGTKEWRLYDTPVDLPLSDAPFDPKTMPRGDETRRFVLEPGDMCYIPRGVIHDAVARDDTSIHITTGIMARTWADLMAEAVHELARRDPALRRSLPPGYANPGFDATAEQARFDTLRTGLVQADVFGAALNRFRDDFLNTRLPRVPGQLTQVMHLSALTDETRIAVRQHLIHEIADLPETHEVQVLCNGVEITLPARADIALRAVLGGGTHRVGDLPGPLNEAETRVLIRRLVREGLVEML